MLQDCAADTAKLYSFSASLREDIRAYNDGRNNLGMIVFYLLIIPGFLATFLYRLSVVCVKKGKLGKFVARLLRRFNIFISSCDISPTAIIGPGLHLPHPLAIVIGDGVVIGKNARIYQSVTLGLRDSSKGSIYPRLGDDVTLYAGAVICGDIKIGDSASIGANSVVLNDVPAHATAAGVPARILDVEATKT